MNTITFDNTWATLAGTPAAKVAAAGYLTYRVDGYQYSAAFKNKRWDGYKSLYRDASDSFPAGLAHEVAEHLTQRGEATQVQDLRGPAPDPWPILQGLDPTLVLQPHQLEAVTRIRQATRGVVQHPTGAGKSVVIVGATVQLAVPTLILVQRKELLYQQYKQFQTLVPKLGNALGIVGDGIWQPAEVTVATIQTLAGRMSKLETLSETKNMLEGYEAVLIDECQHLSANSYTILLRNLPQAYYRVGLSARPHKDGKREQELFVTGLTGPIISAYDNMEGIEMGRLVPADVFLVDAPNYMKPSGKYRYPDEVEAGIIAHEQRNRLAARLAVSFGERGPTLVLTERIAHGQNLRQLLLDEGVEEV